MEAQTKTFIKFFILPLLVAAIFANFYAGRASGRLRIDFFDVGQGDAALITAPSGVQVLVDGGPGQAVLAALGQAMPFYDRTIDLVILTHAHADHYQGLIPVLERYRVKNLMLPALGQQQSGYQAFLQAAAGERARELAATQGMRIWLDESAAIDVMHPGPDPQGGLNDSSFVFRLSHGRAKALFTGDAGSKVEQEIMRRFDLDADLLKVGHHGSRYSTTAGFLNAVTPDWAVIQVGQNNYGHPAEGVLQLLKDGGVQVYRNDEHGTVTFMSDGQAFYLNQ